MQLYGPTIAAENRKVEFFCDAQSKGLNLSTAMMFVNDTLVEVGIHYEFYVNLSHNGSVIRCTMEYNEIPDQMAVSNLTLYVQGKIAH